MEGNKKSMIPNLNGREIFRGCLIAFVGLLLIGCLPSSLIWTGSYTFPHNTWRPADRVNFIPDSSYLSKELKGVKGILMIRYNHDASIESLPLVLDIENPATGEYISDTLTIELLPADKRTANRAEMGIFESERDITLRQTPQPGWNLTVYPIGEGESLKGIYSITFEIVNNKETEK